MTYLVTGAAGFIGSNLMEELLRQGHRVVGLDNFSTGYRHNLDDALEQAGEGVVERFTFIEGDIRDLDTCRRACEGVDYVLHQAALGSVPRSIKDPVTTNDVNIGGTLNMLIAARDTGVKRFVYASSSSVYGDHPDLPKVENQVGTPLSPYAITKRVCEFYAETFYRHYGLETIGLRYFNVFGRRQDPNGAYAAVIPKWIAQMLRGEQCVIFGDGETSRDFCYIANVVQANLKAALAPAEAAGKVYNVAYGDRTTLNQLHQALKDGLKALDDSLNVADPNYKDFRSGDVRHSLADVNLAVAHLSYTPVYDADKGLREAMAWYHRRMQVNV